MRKIVEIVALKIMIVSLIISMVSVFIPCVLNAALFKVTLLQTVITLFVIYSAAILLCLILGYLDDGEIKMTYEG